MLHLKPADGCLVLDPDNGFEPLPADGKFVPDNLYWQRRLLFGEALLADAPEPATTSKNKKG